MNINALSKKEIDVLAGSFKYPRFSKSLVLAIIDWVIWCGSKFSLLCWLGRCRWKRRGDHLHFGSIESWLILLLVAELIFFIAYPRATRIFRNFGQGFAYFVLFDNAMAALRDVFLGPRLHQGHFVIRDGRRWFALTSLCAVQVILGFSILFLANGREFCPEVKDPLTSLYFSLVTFATVGYGDYHPSSISCAAKCLVIIQIVFVLLFLTLKLPLAVAIFTSTTRRPGRKRKVPFRSGRGPVGKFEIR
jgi:hypothetical protein